MKYLPFILLLVSCSSEWHLKKAIKKDPELLTRPAIVRTYLDSIIVTTEGAKADTFFKYLPSPVDTFIFNRPEFRTVVVHDTIERRIEVETECYPDTVVRTVKVKEYLIQPKIDTRTRWEKFTADFGAWFFWVIVVLIAIFVVRLVMKNNPVI